MPRRLDKTLADYMVIALSPALIIVLVNSLMLFLIEVVFQGDQSGRVTWITFLYVLATVLIARISIEEGKERAALFAAPLMGAMTLVMMRFGLSIWVVPILALVWWVSDRLTWDCTLIDEREDSSGQGLLAVVGLDDEGGKAPAQVPTESTAAPSSDNSLGERIERWWNRRHRRRGTPGVWVIYFSLAALPLFGLGQLLVPEEDADRRRYVFWLLFFYVASGLGLLLTTSFLGLRRYLRQRKLEMPASIASVWLTVGGMMAAGLLLAATLIPRPSAEYAISSFGVPKLSDLRANRFAIQRDSPAQGQGTPSSTPTQSPPSTGGAGAQPGPQGQSGQQQSGQQQGGQEQGGQQQSGQQQGAQQQGGQQQGGQQQGGQQQATPSSPPAQSAGQLNQPPHGPMPQTGQQPQADPAQAASQPTHPQPAQAQSPHSAPAQPQPPQSPPPSSPGFQWPNFGSLAALLFRWALNIGLVVLIVYLCIRYRAALAEYWRQFLAAWRGFWARLFGGRGQTAAAEEASPPPPVHPFAAYANPFASGAAQRASGNELVCYTFDALQAWAVERGLGRSPDATPLEFAAQLGASVPPLSDDARELAQYFSRVAYASERLAGEQVKPPLARLWSRLG